MSDKTAELSIPPLLRAACAVYAVAIGDRLGFDLETLKRLRLCVEGSTFCGSDDLDSILRFVAHLTQSGMIGVFPVPDEFVKSDSKVVRAYCDVARLVQPLSVQD